MEGWTGGGCAVQAPVRGVEVSGRQAAYVERDLLRVLPRHPDEDAVHHGEVEHREQDGGDVQPDAKDQRKRSRPFEHGDRGFHASEQHGAVERRVDHVRLDRGRVARRGRGCHGGHRAKPRRRRTRMRSRCSLRRS